MSEDHESPGLITKPRLVLRVGFAGKRDFYPTAEGQPEPSQQEIEALAGQIKGLLDDVFSCIGRQLIELAPHTPCQKGIPPAIAAYYARENPLLRVISGLCEGADTLAYQAAEGIRLECLEVENALVIGFPKIAYRESRDPSFLEEFDRQVAGSAFLLEADGKYEKGPAGKLKRNRAYRCQSDLLLRQSDLLVALVDPAQEGKAGGTLETIRKALDFQLPVVLVHPADLSVRLILPEENLADELESAADPEWPRRLAERVTRIVADPRISEDAFNDEQASHGRLLLKEFFSGTMPAEGHYEDGPAWRKFEARFRTGKPSQEDKPYQLPPPEAFTGKQAFDHYRDRARALAAHYSARYRNAFFRNALFALCAVTLAAVSLLVLVLCGNHPNLPQKLLLIGLAIGEFSLVVMIYLSSHRANHDHWNDRAVDYRYLSERLRAMSFLPAAGIWQPPAAAAPQYASRVVRQSAADWLHDALVRSISPGAWAGDDGVIRPAPLAALRRVKDHWLAGQLKYHLATGLTMQRMERWLRSLGEVLNIAVLSIVFIDIVLLVFKACGTLPAPLKGATPFIVFITAVIPAAVAALNVLRLQSECERLAERSAVLARLLGGRRPGTSQPHDPHPEASGRGRAWDEVSRFFHSLWLKCRVIRHPRADPPAATGGKPEGGKIRDAEALLARLESPAEAALGSHTGKVLHFTESCAQVFVQEVAEWSVLYAKEMVEP